MKFKIYYSLPQVENMDRVHYEEFLQKISADPLLKYLEPCNFVSRLLSDDVLTDDEHGKIMNGKGSRDERKLVSPVHFKKFNKVLFCLVNGSTLFHGIL